MVEIVGEAKTIFNELTSSGLGTAGGFIGGAFVGRQVQTLIGWTDALITGPTDYWNIGKAWVANNGPKIALWYLLRKYDATSETMKDVDKALIGSVAFDTLVRILSGGVNNGVTVGGYQILGAATQAGTAQSAQVQQMAQEINMLRTELKKAMSIAAQPTQFGAPPQYNPVGAPVVTPYVEGARLPAPAGQRATRMGFMEQGPYVSGAPLPVPAAAQPNPPEAQDRQARYGFMQEQKIGISKAAAMCGMQ